jgi:hypothetical protein
VKSFSRGLSVVFVALGMLGVAGCSDNESDAAKAQKTAVDPGARDASHGGELKTTAPPTDMGEYAKRQGNSLQGSGYPGTGGKGAAPKN